MLYRVFPFARGSTENEPGGALYVPRDRQGGGRHDQPGYYGALYATRSPESAIAEHIQVFRGQTLSDRNFRMGATTMAIVAIDDGALGELLDLDDPLELVARQLRPSTVATRMRDTTRSMALGLFEEGHDGFEWWSTIESEWSNVTLFAERSLDRLALVGEPEPLSTRHPAVRLAAEVIGVDLL